MSAPERSLWRHCPAGTVVAQPGGESVSGGNNNGLHRGRGARDSWVRRCTKDDDLIEHVSAHGYCTMNDLPEAGSLDAFVADDRKRQQA